MKISTFKQKSLQIVLGIAKNRFAIAGLILAVVAGLVVYGYPRTKVADVTTLNPVADTYVSSSNPSTNYGSATTLLADGASPIAYAYLKFDLSAYQNTTITSAVLRFRITNSTTGSYDVKEVVDSSWDEATMVYTNAPARTTVYNSFTAPSAPLWREINVVTGANAYKGGLFSVAIESGGTTDGIQFDSREAAENKPELVITTSDGGGSPVPTPVPVVFATVETDPVPSSGDAADDPAIYADPVNPDNSVIFGTDKQSGLAVYDMDGNQLQFLADGNLNNVDIRTDFTLGGQSVILVTASNRSQSRIESYTYNPTTRQLTNVTGSASVGFTVYGYCMYKSPDDGKFYGIVTHDGSSGVRQFELTDSGSGTVNATQVRSITLGSRAEGCVADDDLGHLYIGEEDVAIWKYGAEPGDGSTRTAVDNTIPQGGSVLVPDIEGLTIYYADSSTGYLIASNQGNNSYSVYEREGDNEYLGDFEIANGDIDGTSDTDGIDVSSANLGSNFPYGAFVAQDGSNPGGNQNYKVVPWESIMPSVLEAQEVVVTINPVADSFVRSTEPDTNFGNLAVVEVDDSPIENGYFRFDVSEFAGKEIVAAFARFYALDPSGATMNLALVEDNTWGETTITWNNQPTRSTVLGTIVEPETDTWYQVDIASYLNTHTDNLLSMAIERVSGSGGVDFASREALAHKPELVVTYRNVAAPTPTPTPATTLENSTVIRGGTKFRGGTVIRGNASAAPTPQLYAIGDTGPAGGKVFYDKGSYSDGWRYLEVTTADIAGTNLQWGCSGQSISTGSAIGTGKANTQAIVDFHDNTANFGGNNYYTFSGDFATIGCHTGNDGVVAAKVVSDYSQNGFDDWFLPSKDELNELYGKRTEVGGSFSANYWSSTESMSSNAWYNLFAGGGEYGVNKNNPNIRVRAIRSF